MNELRIIPHHRVLRPDHINAGSLSKDLAWCEQVIGQRLKAHFEEETGDDGMPEIEAPCLHDSESMYAECISKHHFDRAERLGLILALVPVLKPSLFDVLQCRNEMTNRPYTEFGCVESDGVLYASGETLAFLLGGDDLGVRLRLQAFLQADNTFTKLLCKADGDSLVMIRPLRLTEAYVNLFTTGQPYRPELSTAFPAQLVESRSQWKDLVLPSGVMAQLQEIRDWIAHGDALFNEWGLAGKIRPGYRALFYGPPGTGKTMTAGLLGKSIGRDVYKVDLSLIISKYIGETEKNLEKVFSLARDKQWILFFDEADALFGKRIQTAGANDQFVNQNVAYLLQRIEAFDGVAVLASNYEDNIDEAFFRRFESMIYFPLPDAKQRLKIWSEGISAKSYWSAAVDLERIAADHVLSAAEINNVIRHVSLKALSDGRCELREGDLLEGIRRQGSLFAGESGKKCEYDIFT